MSNFDAYHCDLDGRHCVEAGAGTGKTYNIQILFARYILAGNPVDKLLVVTFTENATAELQERLRLVLAKLHDALRDNDASVDLENLEPLTRGFFSEDGTSLFAQSPISVPEARLRIATALRDFDQAPISTIHGFCHRMLKENAFDSDQQFNLQIRADLAEECQALLFDFWRKILAEASPVRTVLFQSLNLTPQELLKTLRPILGDPNAAPDWGKISPGQCDHAIQEIEEHFSSQFSKLADLTRAVQTWYEKALDKKKPLYCLLWYAKALTFLQEAIRQYKEREGVITYNDLLTELRKKLYQPGNRLVDMVRQRFNAALVDEFQDTDATQFAIFDLVFGRSGRPFFIIGDPKQAIYMFRGGDLHTYQEAKDLLDSGQPRLHSLTVNWRSSSEYIAAMNSLFSQKDFFNPSGKELIHFEPIEVPSPNPNTLSWDANVPDSIRQTPLLSCCQYGTANTPAQVPQPIFYDAKTAEEISRLLAWAPHITITDKKGTRHPNAGDIAVLVRTTNDGNKVEKCLHLKGITTCWKDGLSVFATPEARALVALLKALLEPGDTHKVLNALSAPFFHLSATELDSLRLQNLGPIQMHFKGLMDYWEKSSFQGMMSHFLKTPLAEFLGNPVPSGELAGLVTAMGSLTIAEWFSKASEDANGLDYPVLAYAVELLHATALQRRLGPAEILDFLQRKIKQEHPDFFKKDNDLQNTEDAENDSQDEKDKYTVRMRNQDNAVTIMTIHGSKGLQFPFVFVPRFCSSSKHSNPIFHDGRQRRYLVDDSLSLEPPYGQLSPRELAAEEENAEVRRLLYVAITRAEFLCRFLHGPAENKGVKAVFTLDNGLHIPDSELFLPTEQLPPAEQTSETKKPHHPEQLREDFRTTLRPGWFQQSFSAFTKSLDDAPHTPPALKDLDQDDEALPGESLDDLQQDQSTLGDPQLAIFEMPRGTAAGNAWHSFFETLDFSLRGDALATATLQALQNHPQFGSPASPHYAAQTAAFLNMVRGVLENPLPGTDFCLGDIPARDRRHELKFTYQLEGVDFTALKETLRQGRIPCPADWFADSSAMPSFRHVPLTGSIDLLFRRNGRFYILDWKTNALYHNPDKPDLRRFAPEGKAMQEEMNGHFYHLQYLIYTVAFLHWYQSIQPGFQWNEASYQNLFGGIFYLFLRGVSFDAPGRGIYQARPAWETVSNVARILGKARREK